METKRTIGLWQGLAIVVGMIIGSGIFLKPSVVLSFDEIVTSATPGADAAVALTLVGLPVYLHLERRKRGPND